MLRADNPNNTLPQGRDYRLILAVAAIVGLALTFWLGSRYPSLNEKAMMGGDTPLSGLAFDIVFDIFPDSPQWWQFVANTINWIATNVKGMTFGVLFGAAALTLLSLLKARSFENGFANAALGTLIGAPLGVCVNCAAPIALGLHAGRMRLETTLSALLASPTLNVIVVTMSFSLLPLHVALTKFVLAIVMVLLVVPLLCRFILVSETEATRNGMATLAKVSEARGLSAWIGRSLAMTDDFTPTGFSHSLGWFVLKFARNFALIAIITVPMMFLAAMLGAAVAIGFDSAALAGALPRSGWLPILLAMGMIALVASFVPAPIALDVILTIVLMGIGLSTHYSTAILIALGSFSIYAFFVLWKAVSLRTALVMWAAVIGMSVTGGVIAMKTQGWEMQFQAERIDNFVAGRAGFELSRLPALPPATSSAELQAEIKLQTVPQTPVPMTYSSSENSSIRVYLTPLGQIAAQDQREDQVEAHLDASPVFKRIVGTELGFEDVGESTPYQEFAPSMMVGGIAAGDIHNDGWVDIVFRRPRGAFGLSLYANMGGEFRRQHIDLGPVKNLEVANTAFADMNNDGWLDLIVTTFWDGTYIFENDNGHFDSRALTHIAGGDLTTTVAVSFSDINGDGRLDMLFGEWTSRQGQEGWSSLNPVTSANRIIWNDEGGVYRSEVISGSIGQTLTGLVTDVNRDGQPDYLKGDDIKATDQFVFFDENMDTVAGRKEQPFPYYLLSSMSYDEGDWNNDLLPDYYGGQISEPHGSGARNSTRGTGNILEICQQLGRDFNWDRDRIRACAAEMTSVDKIRNFRTGFTYNLCQSGTMSDRDATLCGLVHSMGSIRNGDYFDGQISGETAHSRCQSLVEKWPFIDRYCETFKLPVVPSVTREELQTLHQPALSNGNILMTGSDDGTFVNRATEQNVDLPGWTWNSRFSDLDQDGWQDLLVMTGAWFTPSRASSNIFYQNQSGQFSDQSERFGFEDVTPSYSFAAFDFDRDGDIDIIRPPDGRAVIVHRNDRPRGDALWVTLRDSIGNARGIDARVTICTDGQDQVEPGLCQTRPVNLSGGFMSFDPIAAHFGLGDAKSVSLIEVRWRDGEVTQVLPQDLSGGEVTIVRAP